MCRFGYTSTTVNTNDSQNEPANIWKAPINWYLRTLDMLNIKSLTAPPRVKLLNFIWPYEDKPQDARRSLQGVLGLAEVHIRLCTPARQRVMYPMNLVRDAVFVHLCNPRVFYTNYWLFGQSYKPYQTLQYATINGKLSCVSQNTGGFFIYEYQRERYPRLPFTPTRLYGQRCPWCGRDGAGTSAFCPIPKAYWMAIESTRKLRI
ncbi:MAG: hypothetical protein R2822_28540 [Spirosomataceae bacterium]